jgi:hypothetical protein
MENNISIPYFTTPSTMHFGSDSNYSRFFGSYFIKKDFGDEKFLNKHIIIEVKYEPDEIYRMNDGYGGRCWIVAIIDYENDKMNRYYIRNWIDIVHFYKEKGFEYVQESE